MNIRLFHCQKLGEVGRE